MKTNTKLRSLRTAARDGDRRQAHNRIRRLVNAGILPHPQSVPCFDCGHTGSDRKHHYDHYLGYSAAHQTDVQAVCFPCHYKRSVARGESKFPQAWLSVAANITSCPQGHPYSGDNLYTYPDGRRCCKACRRAIDNERNRVKRLARGSNGSTKAKNIRAEA